MTRDDIIRMAQEAKLSNEIGAFGYPYLPELERFAALVAANERERMKSEGWRHCAEGQRTTQFCGQLDAAVKAERDRLLDAAEWCRVCEQRRFSHEAAAKDATNSG